MKNESAIVAKAEDVSSLYETIDKLQTKNDSNAVDESFETKGETNQAQSNLISTSQEQIAQFVEVKSTPSNDILLSTDVNYGLKKGVLNLYNEKLEFIGHQGNVLTYPIAELKTVCKTYECLFITTLDNKRDSFGLNGDSADQWVARINCMIPEENIEISDVAQASSKEDVETIIIPQKGEETKNKTKRKKLLRIVIGGALILIGLIWMVSDGLSASKKAVKSDDGFWDKVSSISKTVARQISGNSTDQNKSDNTESTESAYDLDKYYKEYEALSALDSKSAYPSGLEQAVAMGIYKDLSVKYILDYMFKNPEISFTYLFDSVLISYLGNYKFEAGGDYVYYGKITYRVYEDGTVCLHSDSNDIEKIIQLLAVNLGYNY